MKTQRFEQGILTSTSGKGFRAFRDCLLRVAECGSDRGSDPPDAHRCGQPGQQHGRRIPSLKLRAHLSTCCRLVSSFLTEMVQQIHSLRASCVMSSHAARACASDASAFRRSGGRSCTAPPEIRTVATASPRLVSAFAHDLLKDQASHTTIREIP